MSSTSMRTLMIPCSIDVLMERLSHVHGSRVVCILGSCRYLLYGVFYFFTEKVLLCSICFIGTVVYEKMCKTLTTDSLMKGIQQASPFEQTSCLEGFHSVLNQFAPKMIGYSYSGMYCRYIILTSLFMPASVPISQPP